MGETIEKRQGMASVSVESDCMHVLARVLAARCAVSDQRRHHTDRSATTVAAISAVFQVRLRSAVRSPLFVIRLFDVS